MHVEKIDGQHVVRYKWGRAMFYPMDADVCLFQGFEPILELYRRKCSPGFTPPKKTSLHFSELRGWHANINIMYFAGPAEDGVIRLLGEEYKRLFAGTLWQGMHLHEVDHPRLQNLEQYCRRLLDTPCIGRFVGYLPHVGREHVVADILDLPACDEAGNVAFLMSFIREISEDTL